jgi:hypothetical protein
MRYVLSILLIAVLLTITTGYYLFQKNKPDPDQGLVINDRRISSSEFEKIYRNFSQTKEDRPQFIESLIIRELLIQEARKIGLDQDEDFRSSIQNFYEQSLAKILFERKADTFTYNPSQQEIARFLELQDYQVEIALWAISDQGACEEKKYATAFRDLAASMQVAVLPLAVGAESAPFLLDEQEYILRLDSLIKRPGADDADISPEQARQIIALDHQEQSVANWLHGLRKHAKVTIGAAIRGGK